MLLEEAEYREYVVSHGSGASIAAHPNRHPSAVEVLHWTSREADAEQRERVFEWLWTKLRLHAASAEEAAAARDLQVLRRIAQADRPAGRRFRTPEAAWVYAEEEFRRQLGRKPAPVPEAVKREREEIIRERHEEAVPDTESFRRELGKLPEQTPDQQRRTIADWVRMGRKAGIVPSRPARPKGLTRRTHPS